MMESAFTANYIDTSRAKMIELPYSDVGISALIMLPDEGVIDQFRHQLNDNKLNLAKFNLELRSQAYSTEKNTVKLLGAETAFDPEKAELNDISDKMRLYIGDMVHKTQIKFDESGSESCC